jgi:hypothetical protein
MSGIEIYVRHRNEGTMLNIYLDQETKAALIAALENGKFEDPRIPINLELSILNEWLSDENSAHVRIPISEINISAEG